MQFDFFWVEWRWSRFPSRKNPASRCPFPIGSKRHRQILYLDTIDRYSIQIQEFFYLNISRYFGQMSEKYVNSKLIFITTCHYLTSETQGFEQCLDPTGFVQQSKFFPWLTKFALKWQHSLEWRIISSQFVIGLGATFALKPTSPATSQKYVDQMEVVPRRNMYRAHFWMKKQSSCGIYCLDLCLELGSIFPVRNDWWRETMTWHQSIG